MRCWFFRLMISAAADSDADIGRATRRHVARCADCRQFHESCRRLDQGLRSQASGWQHVSGRSMMNAESGVRSAGRDDEFRIRRVPHSARSPVRAALAVAACLAIAAGTTTLLRVRGTEPPAPPRTMAGAPIPVGIDSPTAWVHLIERPLATEVQSLTRDTESGIRFLVACLNVGLPNGATAPSDQPLPPQ